MILRGEEDHDGTGERTAPGGMPHSRPDLFLSAFSWKK